MKNYRILDSCNNCMHCMITVVGEVEDDYDTTEYHRCNVNGDFVAWQEEKDGESAETKKARQESNDRHFAWIENHQVDKNGKCDSYKKKE